MAKNRGLTERQGYFVAGGIMLLWAVFLVGLVMQHAGR